MSSLLSRMVLGSASDNETKSDSSNLSSVTENSFCFLTSSYLIISNSFFSMLTTAASNYSSRPDSVTMKLMMVH